LTSLLGLDWQIQAADGFDTQATQPKGFANPVGRQVGSDVNHLPDYYRNREIFCLIPISGFAIIVLASAKNYKNQI
jgi:hypothetical protein